ncbi:MAG: FAD-binding oxidoreductase, partial [Actinomycetota bacterium]|nr:FAD-binding oxidoreductase [Actinomycetota bacterium]
MGRQAALDIAVVGGGIVGLATAVAAHDRGLEVTCFEAARPGASQSAGRTRIFRHRHERAELVELGVRSRREWGRWERRLGRRLVGDEGVLVAGPDLEDHAGRFAAAGVEYSEVDPSAQRRVLPILASLGETALLDPKGGAIRIRDAVEALVGWLGERLVLAEVLSLEEAEGLLEVHTTEGIWRARRAVLCAGSGTDTLARPLGFELPVAHGCQLRATFAVREGLAYDGLACLLDRRDAAASGVYASQCEETPCYTVGLHSSEVALPDGTAPIPPTESLSPSVEHTSRYVAENLPGLHPEPVELRLCRTTKLPWGSDAFAAWQRGPVTAFAGNNVFK